MCVCVCVRDKGASIKRVFLGPTLSHFLCKYFERVRAREMHIILCLARQLDNCPAHYTRILLWWAPLISVSCCLSLLDGSSLSHCMHLMRVSSTIFLLPPNDNDIMLWRVVLCYHISVISNLSPCVCRGNLLPNYPTTILYVSLSLCFSDVIVCIFLPIGLSV